MKLKHALIQNFKGAKKCEIDFADRGSPRPVTALLGDNGSGKTSVLQAIGLVLSMAGRRTPSADNFRWHGFLADRVSSMGRTRVELTIEFDEPEIKITKSLFQQWRQSLPAVLIDELELHLHPPQQQALLASLPKLGPDCQFIITTHSSYLEGVIPIEHEVRLEGGRSCL